MCGWNKTEKKISINSGIINSKSMGLPILDDEEMAARVAVGGVSFNPIQIFKAGMMTKNYRAAAGGE